MIAKTIGYACDAFGIKPVFYTDGFLFFASTALVTLMAQTPEVNLQQAYDYLCYGYYDDAQASFSKTYFTCSRVII